MRHFVLFPTAHPVALRPTVCGGGGLLGVPRGDGASSGPQLHPHRLSQTQPPRPRQGGVCRVGKQFSQPDPLPMISPQINGFIHNCPDGHFVRADSGPLGENPSGCIGTKLFGLNSPAVNDLLNRKP